MARTSLELFEQTEMSGPLTSNIPVSTPPVGNVTQNSPASSGKVYDIPVALTSQNLHQELARAHAALLVDSTNSSLPTPEPHLECSGELVSSALASADAHSETYKNNGNSQVGERVATFSPKLSTPHLLSKKEKSRRGLTTYGRLEKVDKETEPESIQEGVKDMWGFDQFTQDHYVTKSRMHTGSTFISNKPKQRSSVQAKDGSGAHSDSCSENWMEKKSQKQSKKVASRKVKRSKTSGGASLDDYGILQDEPFIFDNGEDDEDYSPVGSRRTVRKRVTTDLTLSYERKKTRSNTNEWELMPALPKGRRAAVLKQLEAGFVLEGGESYACHNRASPIVEPLPHENVIALSPFKVDLAKNSLSLPEEEKGKYTIFSPTATPSILKPPLESSASHSLPAVFPQEPPDSQTVEAGNINTTFPIEEHFRCRGVLNRSYTEDTQPVLESISVPPTSPQPPTVQRSLVSRSKTLAQILETDPDLIQDKTHDGARLPEPTGAPIHPPTCPRKRARWKKARTKTAIVLSREHSPAPRAKRSRIVAASDDESPLSDLDEDEIHPPADAPDIDTPTPSRRLQKPKPVNLQLLDLKESPALVLPPQSINPAVRCGIENQSMSVVHNEAQLHEGDLQGLDDVISGSNTKRILARGRKPSKGNPETLCQANVRGDVSCCYVSVHEDSLSDRGNYDATIQSVGTNHVVHSQVNEEGKAPQKEISPPSTPQKANPRQLEHTKPAKGPHSPINGGKPPTIKFRVGLSRRANIESLHAYLRK